MKRRVLILLILIAPLGILFPHLGDFAFPPQSNYSDIAISHYPNAVYLIQSMLNYHQLPLWSDTILSGYPFAADPLAGIWYLPGWLAYIFPLPMGFNLDALLHLLWGGIGIFFYLKKEKKSDYASLAGAILFELFSKTFAHYAAGHLTLLYAVAWTPWIFLCEKYYRKGKGSIFSGVVLGMVALADVRWFAFLAIAWAAFALYNWWLEGEQKTWKSAGILVVRIAGLTALALLIAAPLLVPLVEYTGLTTRANLTVADNLSLGLPPAYLANLAIPNLQAYAEWVIYPGGAALILALFGLSLAEFRKRNIFSIVTILGVLIIALGDATPVGALLFRLPGFDWLRVPSRVIFLLGWAFAMLAADGIDFLYNVKRTEKKAKPPGNGLAMVAVAGFMILICVGLAVYSGSVPVAFVWGTVAVCMATLLVLLRRSGRISGNVWSIAILLLICLDLGGVDSLNVQFKPAKEVTEQGETVAANLPSINGDELFRVYSPSYSMPQQMAAVKRLELADGIDPLQLTSYVNFMQNATGIPDKGYSVTLPPYKTGSPEIDNLESVPDTQLLALLNVKYVVSDFPLNSQGLVSLQIIGEKNIYLNINYRPRAWVQANLDPGNLKYLQVSSIQWTPNEMEIRATGEGWLVVSEMDYPGWTAAVDGKAAVIVPFDNLLRAVQLGPGEHTVVFDFRPVTVYVGIGLSIIGWLAIIGIAWAREDMVEKGERRWQLYFALAVLIVTTLPYLIGFWVQGDQWRFTGFVFGAEDGNSYIAKMLGGATGDWLFRTPYTAYPQNEVIAFLPYILLGKLAAPPAQHDQLVFLFQLFRWIGGFMVIFATYDFTAVFIRRVQYRRLATALITLGGGLGWLAPFGLTSLWQGRIPLEFYSPETFGFLSIMGLPHLEVARACLLWGMRSYLTNAEGFSWKRAIRGGLWWLALGFFQPLTVVVGWAVMGLHALVVVAWKNWRKIRPVQILRHESEGKWIISGAVMVLISAPIVGYTFISFSIDPFLRQWTAQNLILSPPIGDYLLAYLIVLPLAITGIVIVFRKRDFYATLLAVWIIAFPILAYAPYNLQRRLPEGVWAALIILSVVVIEAYLVKYRKATTVWSALGYLATLIFFVGAIFTVASPNSPLFIPKAEADAFQFMNGVVQKSDVVLADFRISNELPAWTPVRIIVGHGPESIDAANLTPRITSFFAKSGKDEDRRALISEFNVKFVISGPDEQTPQSWDPGVSRLAGLIYQNSSFKIYRITNP